MVKTLAAAGVLAIAGSAVAAPFIVDGATINGQSDAGFTSNPALFGLFGPNIPAGVLWEGPIGGSGLETGTTLVGINPGGAPAAGANPASDGALAAPVIATTELSGPGGTDFSVSFTFGTGSGFESVGDRMWLGQIYSPGAVNIDVNLDMRAGDNLARAFVAGGSSVDVDGQNLKLILEPIDGAPGGGTAANLILQVVPAPGAMALMGLAGVAGLRRRRA